MNTKEQRYKPCGAGECCFTEIEQLKNTIDEQDEVMNQLVETNDMFQDQLKAKDAEIERLKEYEWMYKDLCK